VLERGQPVKGGVLVSMTVHSPHSKPAASPATSTRLLGVYLQCVERGIWARIQLESRGGVEEVTFWCSETTAAERKTKKRPPNARRQQYNRERREAWLKEKKCLRIRPFNSSFSHSSALSRSSSSQG
jgi:hypothetical protein